MDVAPLMLSVSGMRGLVGQSLTPVVVCRYSASFGTWLGEQCGSGNTAPLVVVGRDSRPSGDMIEHAVIAGLIASGCRVVRLGIVSTPGVAVMIGKLEAAGGMVITASHNPLPWNGLKPLRHDGVAPPTDDVTKIIRLFREDQQSYAGIDQLQPVIADDTAAAYHCDRVCEYVDVDLIRQSGLRVVIDSVHGAGGPEARLLMDQLGVELVHLHAETTGRFPHNPEPVREHLTGLCDAVIEHKADIGFAQDPDADRLAVVDDRGMYIGEEFTLALCTLHTLGGGMAFDRRPEVVVANLSTSRMVDDIAAGFGARVVRTPVGEANVAAAMREHSALIGGEGNGGVIWMPLSQVRDSLIGMAILLHMLAARKMKLSQIVDQMTQYHIVKQKIAASRELIEMIPARMTRYYQSQRIDTQDGVRVDWDDCWVHVRPSNTEPIIRIIAEARSPERATELVDQACRLLETGNVSSEV